METANYTDYPCPTGYYCPTNTQYWNDNPCPAGTFNNETTKYALSHCISCPGGQFCAGVGQSLPSGGCDASYYCDGGSITATPSGSGGNHCSAGTYCPVGSSFAVPCRPGHYCGADYLNDTSGLCDAGYYCHSYATLPNPGDLNVTGEYYF